MTLRLTAAQARKMGLKIVTAPCSDTLAAGIRRRGRMPVDVLWQAVTCTYPRAVRELAGVIPGRRFRIDIALEEVKIAIEVDGWQYHGKHRKAHESDRERQNLFAVHGWMVLRFTAGQIFKDIEGVMATVATACRQRGMA